MKNKNIDVLWIEDDTDLVESSKFIAETYNITLHSYENWNEGKKDLEENFEDYSSIIFDLHCKLDNHGKAEDTFFLTVLYELQDIFNKKQSMIPWFIYTGGTGAFDESTLFLTIKNLIPKVREEWGQIFIKEPGSLEKLLIRIEQVTKNLVDYKIINKHYKTFEILKTFSNKKVVNFMLKGLEPLYKPDLKLTEGNLGDLRKIIEEIGNEAYKLGLMPDNYSDGKTVNLECCCRILNGLDYYGERYTANINERILPQPIDDILYYLKNITSGAGNHSNSTNWNKEYLITSCALQMCIVVESFGDFCKSHPNKYENKKNLVKVKTITDKNNKTKIIRYELD